VFRHAPKLHRQHHDAFQRDKHNCALRLLSIISCLSTSAQLSSILPFSTTHTCIQKFYNTTMPCLNLSAVDFGWWSSSRKGVFAALCLLTHEYQQRNPVLVLPRFWSRHHAPPTPLQSEYSSQPTLTLPLTKPLPTHSMPLKTFGITTTMLLMRYPPTSRPVPMPT
jgi:hypothetical protein